MSLLISRQGLSKKILIWANKLMPRITKYLEYNFYKMERNNIQKSVINSLIADKIMISQNIIFEDYIIQYDFNHSIEENFTCKVLHDEWICPLMDIFYNDQINQKLLILCGSAGVGKSILLKYIIYKTIKFYKHNKLSEIFVPFFIFINNEEEFKEFNNKYTKDILANLIFLPIKKNDILKLELIKLIINNFRCIFFIEGIDILQKTGEFLEKIKNEVNEKSKIFLLSRYKIAGYFNCSIIPSKITKNYISEPINKYILYTFSLEMCKKFNSEIDIQHINKEASIKSAEFTNLINGIEHLSILASNPLILTIIMLLFINDSKLFDSKSNLSILNRNKILNEFIDCFLFLKRKQEEKIPTNLKRNVINFIARRMMEERAVSVKEDKIIEYVKEFLEINKIDLTAKSVLDEILKIYSILIKYKICDIDYVSFMHRIFQEFLAAECYIKEYKKTNEMYESKYTDDQWWYEVMRFIMIFDSEMEGNFVCDIIRKYNNFKSNFKSFVYGFLISELSILNLKSNVRTKIINKLKNLARSDKSIYEVIEKLSFEDVKIELTYPNNYIDIYKEETLEISLLTRFPRRSLKIKFEHLNGIEYINGNEFNIHKNENIKITIKAHKIDTFFIKYSLNDYIINDTKGIEIISQKVDLTF